MTPLRISVAVLITLIWAAMMVRTLSDNEFNAPGEVSGLMLLVVTWLLGSEVKDKFTKKNGD